ncbi:uncharacterized protein LOC126687822 [Mercurialis annua]|uniref:uncharacterized protein LOC126687822 n=1 Tax=Mercurialis annua TaxID=3986 RepID=UPI0021609B78|nr:uncharacterized protein LOC126687822 [Mercurialis annua]
MASLRKRRMDVNECCPSCKADKENGIHVVWFCKQAKQVWRSWQVAKRISPERWWSTKDLLLLGFNVLTKQEFMIFGVLLWLIWNRRNCGLFNTPCKPVDQTLDWAKAYVEDFEKDKQGKDKIDPRRRENENLASDMRWIPPDKGVFCVNVDAGFSNSEHTFSSGVVIRNHQGKVLVASCNRYEGKPMVSTGEAVAIRDGFCRAMEEGLTPFILYSDSKVVVDLFTNKELVCNEASLIVQDCIFLNSSKICKNILYGSRNTNRVAHLLARKALTEHAVANIWREFVPPNILQSVMVDIQLID